MNRIESEASRSSVRAAGWRYWPSPAEGLLEVGALNGAAAGLATHFHEEVQITFVTTGRRRMHVAGRHVDLEAGRCICIPAGLPHGGTREAPGVGGLIAYAAPGDYDLDGLAASIEALWRDTRDLSWGTLGALVTAHRRGPLVDMRRGAPIALLARTRMSREGFSRRFARQTGMPPHAFDVASRLNEARGLLRAGVPIADVAAATRFADQSHLGRCFRRAFGVTPGVYGRSHRAVTNVPDE